MTILLKTKNNPSRDEKDKLIKILPHPVSYQVESSINHIVSDKVTIPKGGEIFHTQSRCKYLYIIQKGYVKLSLLLIDGREQVTGFYIEGELFGFDGLAQGEHQCDAFALTETELCLIPIENIINEDQHASNNYFASFLYKIMSREIRRDQRNIALLGALNAEERLIAFLLNLSYRKMLRGKNSENLNIPMSRSELGNYLGLTSETVSRSFTKLQKNQVISIVGRKIILNDIKKMQNWVGPNFS